ncbi:hypothetical protein [Corynebacterium endometrii]|uniref:Uncharacterized protein n=1 Tax=Corynebacterium endometrii TaxID=2488819 RepID=A0A4P7QK96_9CORY|nr:hypothetical protein [Corynebacterium endometrii]QCB29414.1 hypothetical protein CENDO_10820 [Corynebacterium endometrii]
MFKNLTINPMSIWWTQARSGWLFLGVASLLIANQVVAVLTADTVAWASLAFGLGFALALTGVMLLPLENFRAFGLQRRDYIAGSAVALTIALGLVTVTQVFFIRWQFLALELALVVLIFAGYTAFTLRKDGVAARDTLRFEAVTRPTLANRSPMWMALVTLVVLPAAVLLGRSTLPFASFGWIAWPMLLGWSAAPLGMSHNHSNWLAFGRTRKELRNRNLLNAALLLISALISGYAFNGTLTAGLAIYIFALIAMALAMLWNGGGAGLSVWAGFLMGDFIEFPSLMNAYVLIMSALLLPFVIYCLFFRPMRLKLPNAKK